MKAFILAVFVLAGAAMFHVATTDAAVQKATQQESTRINADAYRIDKQIKPRVSYSEGSAGFDNCELPPETEEFSIECCARVIDCTVTSVENICTGETIQTGVSCDGDVTSCLICDSEFKAPSV